MKAVLVNVKDLDSKCMSASRFVEYTEEDFKDITSMQQLRGFCNNLSGCKVKKCNIKKAIVENREFIISNVERQKERELKDFKQSLRDFLNKIGA